MDMAPGLEKGCGESKWGVLEQRNEGQGVRPTPSFTHLFFQLFSQHEYNTQWGAKGRPEAHGTHRDGMEWATAGWGERRRVHGRGVQAGGRADHSLEGGSSSEALVGVSRLVVVVGAAVPGPDGAQSSWPLTSDLSPPLSSAAGRLWRVPDAAERLLPVPLGVPARQPAPLLPGLPAERKCPILDPQCSHGDLAPLESLGHVSV